MDAKPFTLLLVFGVASSLVFGCGLLPMGRTCNQGCSNPVQAATKLAGSNLAALNPDDVQVLADLATQISGAPFPAVTDDQAAAVISFLKANNVNTVEDLQALIEQAQANPDILVIPDDVWAVLEAIAANPDAYINAAGQLGI